MTLLLWLWSPNSSIMSPGSSPEMHDLRPHPRLIIRTHILTGSQAMCVHIWLCCWPCPKAVIASPISQSKKLSFREVQCAAHSPKVKPNVNLACCGQPWARCCRCGVHTSVQKRGLARTVMTVLGPQSSDFTGRWSMTCILSCLYLHPLDLVRGKIVMSSFCTMHLRETKSHLEVGTKGGLT